MDTLLGILGVAAVLVIVVGIVAYFIGPPSGMDDSD